MDLALGLYSVSEEDGDVEVCVELASLPPGGQLECEITVPFRVTDGPLTRKSVIMMHSVGITFNKPVPAELEVDYTGGPGDVVFHAASMPGDTACARMAVINDEVFECAHTFTVAVDSTPETYVIGQRVQAVVMIVDDEGIVHFVFCVFCTELLSALLTEAVVEFLEGEYTVEEGSDTVSVCVDSGITGGFERALTIGLTAQDGTACRLKSETLTALY